MAKQRKLVFRLAAGFIAVVLASMSGYCFWAGDDIATPVNELEKAAPIQMDVDISKPGQYSCRIKHSRYAEYAKHGAILYLEHDSELTMRQIHSKLHGKIELFNSHGKVCNLTKLPIENIAYQTSEDEMKGSPASWVLYPFTSEQMGFKLTVTEPVVELAGIKQTLRAYYLLNGIEPKPAGIRLLCGIIFGSVSLSIAILILITTIGQKRSGRRKTQFEDYIKTTMQLDEQD